MRLATNESWQDKEQQWQERTEWHRVTVLGKRAESLAKFLRKGMSVTVDGQGSSAGAPEEAPPATLLPGETGFEQPPDGGGSKGSSRADEMSFTSPGQAEREDVVAALDECAFAECRQQLRDLRWQPRARERRERLLGRTVGRLEEPLGAPATSLVDLELGEMVKILTEGPPFALGLLRDLFGVARERRQLQRSHQDAERLDRRGRDHGRRRRAHVPTSASSAS
jgi:hypothetical protein